METITAKSKAKDCEMYPCRTCRGKLHFDRGSRRAANISMIGLFTSGKKIRSKLGAWTSRPESII